MKKQLILVKANLQYFNTTGEESRRKFVDELTSTIKTELLSKEPVGILVYDKSLIESISLIELDTENVVV